MAKTVVGLLDNYNEANEVVDDLVRNGFSREDIGLIAQDRDEKFPSETARERGDTQGDAVRGAGTGAAIGGAAGLVVGITALVIPGVGPIIAAGPIASVLAGAGIGAVAGGLIGGLVNMGVTEEHAEYYAEGVRRGGVLVTVATEDARAEEAVDIMRRHGAVDIDKRAAEWKSSGWNRFDESAPTTREREGVVPIVEEDVRIGKRQVDTGGVRVERHTREEPVEEDVTLRETRAKVERRPVDRPLSAADSDEAFRETSIEIPETSEEPVVSKQARVKEEVVIGREEKKRTERIRETARKTDVDVRAGAPPRGVGDEGFLTPDDEDFQKHFQSYYAQRGEDYQGFRAAYRFGVTKSKHNDKDWREIEDDIRRDWDKDHPGTWGKYKEAIHYGWEKEAHRH